MSLESPAVATPTAPKKTPKLPKKELHTSEIPLVQHPSFELPPLGEPVEHPDNHIAVVEKDRLHKEWLDAIAFGEQAVTIRITPGQEPWASPYAEAWIEGRPIEVLDRGKWIFPRPPACGVMKGVPVTTKRKYVEVLMRSLTEHIKTRVVAPTDPNEDYQNFLDRHHTANVPLSILHDSCPDPGKAREWATRTLGLGYSA